LATKTLLTDEEARRVVEAVAAAEKKSGGEITTAIIAESDDYGFRELVFGIIVGAVVWSLAVGFAPLIDSLLGRVFWSPDPWLTSVIQGAVGMLAGGLAYLAAQIPALDRLIVSKRAMREAVGKRARRHFMESGTYDTVDRTGVLIFVSVLERWVELIADRGINEQVDPNTWSSIVNKLTEGIRAGRTGDALVEAVQACGDVLDGRVARRPDDTNELSDRPDQLESGS
jgi:putative membrane protein